MAGLERRKEDALLVHLEYIREDIKRLEASFQDTRKELIATNDAQWEKLNSLGSKVDKQVGRSSILAIIAGVATSVLIQFGFKK
jgi:hypothetical protein